MSGKGKKNAGKTQNPSQPKVTPISKPAPLVIDPAVLAKLAAEAKPKVEVPPAKPIEEVKGESSKAAEQVIKPPAAEEQKADQKGKAPSVRPDVQENLEEVVPEEEEKQNKKVLSPEEEKAEKKRKGDIARKLMHDRAEPLQIRAVEKVAKIDRPDPKGKAQIEVFDKPDGCCYACLKKLVGIHNQQKVFLSSGIAQTSFIHLDMFLEKSTGIITDGVLPEEVEEKGLKPKLENGTPNGDAHTLARNAILRDRKSPKGVYVEGNIGDVHIYHREIASGVGAAAYKDPIIDMYLCGCKAPDSINAALRAELATKVTDFNLLADPHCEMITLGKQKSIGVPRIAKREKFLEDTQRRTYLQCGINMSSEAYKFFGILFYTILLGILGKSIDTASRGACESFASIYRNWNEWNHKDDVVRSISEKKRRDINILKLPSIAKLTSLGAIKKDGNTLTISPWFQVGYEFALDGAKFVEDVIAERITATTSALLQENPITILRKSLNISDVASVKVELNLWNKVKLMVVNFTKSVVDKKVSWVSEVISDGEADRLAQRITTLRERPNGESVWNEIMTFFDLNTETEKVHLTELDTILSQGSVQKAIKVKNQLGSDIDLDVIHHSHFAKINNARSIQLRAYARNFLKNADSLSDAISALKKEWTDEEIKSVSGRGKPTAIAPRGNKPKGDSVKGEPEAVDVANPEAEVITDDKGHKRVPKSARTRFEPFWCTHCGGKDHKRDSKDGYTCGEERASAEVRKAAAVHNKNLFDRIVAKKSSKRPDNEEKGDEPDWDNVGGAERPAGGPSKGKRPAGKPERPVGGSPGDQYVTVSVLNETLERFLAKLQPAAK
jgi:hypothetical protein